MNTPSSPFTGVRAGLLAVLLACGIAGCSSSDTPTNPGGGNGSTESNLSFDRLGMAVPVGTTQTLEVQALAGSLDPVSVSSDNSAVAGVATAKLSSAAATITVTGAGTGSATITVSTEAGDSRQFPVAVYDPTVLDCGEYLVKFVHTFEYQWKDQGTGAEASVGLFMPVVPEGYHALGVIDALSYATGTLEGLSWAVVIKDKGLDPSRPAIVDPVSYEPIISAWGATFYRPVPPTDLQDEYVALGVVLGPSNVTEPFHPAVCVRKDLTAIAASERRWTDAGSGSSLPIMSVWRTNTRTAVGDVKPYTDLEKEYLSTGSCVVMPDRSDPQLSPVFSQVARVLKIEPQVLINASYQEWVPTLSSAAGPTQKDTQPIQSVVMLVPFVAFNDPGVPSLRWQVDNTPFYVLERRQYWNEEFLGNLGGVRSWTTGIDETTVNESWEESMEVSFDAGVALKTATSGRPSISGVVTRTLGFSSSESVGVFQQDETSVELLPPPENGRVALWRLRNQFLLSRHGETGVEQFLVPWTFDEKVFHKDEYPD